MNLFLTIFLLVDQPIHIDRINMELSILYLSSSHCQNCINDVFLSLKINNADPNEMPLYAALHLGLHSLPKIFFISYLSNQLHCCTLPDKRCLSDGHDDVALFEWCL